jgi:hypothetical protein
MHRSRVLPVMLVLALAGCDQFRGNERAALAIIIPPCPIAAVLSDAVTVTKFKPGAPAVANPDPNTVMFTAEMAKPVLTCRYDNKKITLSVDVAFPVRASRGPGVATDPPLDFFVAVVDVENNVLVKKVYEFQPALGGNRSAQWTQNVKDVVVPIEMDKRPADYEILTGFQLTPDELALNRVPKTAPVPVARP